MEHTKGYKGIKDLEQAQPGPREDPRLDQGSAQQIPALRAKFKVESCEQRLAGSGPGQEVRTVRLAVVTADSEENKKFFKWTPSGRIEIGLLNQEAWEKLQLGQEVYVDFSPVTG